jgi:hypothetical protein
LISASTECTSSEAIPFSFPPQLIGCPWNFVCWHGTSSALMRCSYFHVDLVCANSAPGRLGMRALQIAFGACWNSEIFRRSKYASFSFLLKPQIALFHSKVPRRFSITGYAAFPTPFFIFFGLFLFWCCLPCLAIAFMLLSRRICSSANCAVLCLGGNTST